MPNLHSLQTDNHRIETWTYTDAAARAAATGFTPDDVGRLAFQQDTSTYWRLTDDSPITWLQVTGAGSAGGVQSVSATAPLASSGGSTPTIGVQNQSANTVLAGPASGAAAAPAFRALVGADLPAASTTAAGIVELATDGENAASLAVQANDSRLSNARTPTAHTHAAADITSGTIDSARLPAATTSAAGIVELATDGESAANLAIQANDSRLPSQAFAEAVDDRVAALLATTAGLELTYNDAAGTLTLVYHRTFAGWYFEATPTTGDHQGPTYTADFNMTVTGILGYAVTAPAGSAAIFDIEYKRGAGAWTTIFSTLPQFAAGSNTPTSGTLIASPALNAGDLIRFNWDAVNGIAGATVQLQVKSR